MDILSKTLDLIDNVINDIEIKDINFYDYLLNLMSSLYKNCSIALFFYENTNFILKSAVKDNKKTDITFPLSFENIERLFDSKDKFIKIKTQKTDFLKAETIVAKLAIKESVFGFALLSSDSLNDDKILDSFIAICNIVSYKIKDYELNEVFKIQLKALQEAIIEKENAFEIIKKQHKKLLELDKAKNLFLANISHELRTPLNAIIGFSQALDSKIFGELNQKQAEYIKDIQISSLHLLGMINEILDISKLESNAIKFSPIELDPKTVINEVINILEPLYKNKNIKVEFISNFNGTIKADYQKFQQILYNLLSNAIKYTFENGKIEIISDFQNKDYILKIKDNGIGIEKKYHNKIFKKFVHLNNIYTKNQSSTGLGLTITKELVKLHNGKIFLESELEKGSTFTMIFKKMVI